MMPHVSSVNQVYAMINKDENQRILVGKNNLMNGHMNPMAMLTSRTGGDNYK